LNCGLFSEVMVSTDDVEIADFARSQGANVPFLRSKASSDDFATTLDVLVEVCKGYESLGVKIETICCLYPTAPFVSSTKIKDAYTIFETEGFDTVLPIMPFSYPIQRALEKSSNGKLQYKFETFKNARSQDLMACYHDAGQFYWT